MPFKMGEKNIKWKIKDKKQMKSGAEQNRKQKKNRWIPSAGSWCRGEERNAQQWANEMRRCCNLRGSVFCHRHTQIKRRQMGKDALQFHVDNSFLLFCSLTRLLVYRTFVCLTFRVIFIHSFIQRATTVYIENFVRPSYFDPHCFHEYFVCTFFIGRFECRVNFEQEETKQKQTAHRSMFVL